MLIENIPFVPVAAQEPQPGLKIFCNGCEEPLETPGALLFSPPLRDKPTTVEKFHLCIKCWQQLKNFMEL